jgi:hypothetical protein
LGPIDKQLGVVIIRAMLDTPAQPTTPPGVVLVHDETDLRAAIRERINQLETTQAGLDAAAGLPDRFASKLLCEPPMRRMTPAVLWLVLPALGYDVGLVPNAAALAKVRGLLTKRKVWNQPPRVQAIAKPRATPWLFDSERAKQIGRLGGLARAAKLHANAAISEVRRQAAFKRWRHRPVKTS